MLLGSASPGNLFGNLHKWKEGPHGGDSVLGSCSGSIPLPVKELKGRKIWHQPGDSREISLKSRQQQTEVGEKAFIRAEEAHTCSRHIKKRTFCKGGGGSDGEPKIQPRCKGQFFFFNSSFLPFIPSTSLLPLPTLAPSLCIWGKAFHGNQHSMAYQVEAGPSPSFPSPLSRLNKASHHRV